MEPDWFSLDDLEAEASSKFGDAQVDVKVDELDFGCRPFRFWTLADCAWSACASAQRSALRWAFSIFVEARAIDGLASTG